MNQKPLIVLIAGPYRSGTNDDPALIAANLKALESYALPLYRAGHIPMIGEWVALPIIRDAGGKQIGDSIHQQFLYPVASRLLERCDAVLRVPDFCGPVRARCGQPCRVSCRRGYAGRAPVLGRKS